VQLKAGDRLIEGSNLGCDVRYDQILHLPIFLKQVLAGIFQL
jgi:hypothetical protein